MGHKLWKKEFDPVIFDETNCLEILLSRLFPSVHRVFSPVPLKVLVL
jgi:hypothetical protein